MLQPKDIDLLNGYKNKTHIYMQSTRDPFQKQGHIQTESVGIEKVIPCNRNQKKDGVLILISDKIDFKIKTIPRDKEDTT